jgi:3',5'-cyclic AMP phosphodiesterase CpdA
MDREWRKQGFMLLVQLSDIHYGSMFRKKMLQCAINEINSIDPDLTIVTGDLTEEGLITEFQKVSKQLKKLKTEKIVYISGNHDYRSTGYLIFQKLFPFSRITVIDNTVLIVVSSARPDRDDGEVGYRQNLWLESTLAKYSEHTKIVAIHHHIVPVPDTGADQITVIDAGDILRTLTNSNVDLVLCGHRHRPWRWKVGNMKVIHAGSVSSEKLRGFFCNSYNVIEIKKGIIDEKLKIVDGEIVDFNDIVQRKEILSKLDIK